VLTHVHVHTAGGYSELYVPFCGLAVIEQLACTKSKVRARQNLGGVAPGGTQAALGWQQDVARQPWVAFEVVKIKNSAGGGATWESERCPQSGHLHPTCGEGSLLAL